MIFYEMSEMQRKVYIDTAQVYAGYVAAFKKSKKYSGGMHWKKAKGREYLFRTLDRYGYGKSLGPRSSATERTLTEFRSAKSQTNNKLKALKERLKEQSRFGKAAMINRVPKIVTGILRLLHQYNILGRNVIIVGTNAMYAYEAAAGGFLDSPLLATQDMDILWDIRPKLNIVTDIDPKHTGLLGIVRKVDKTFELLQAESFRAVNKNGFMVDLIKSEPKGLLQKEPVRMGEADDFKAAEIQNLHWLLSAPKFSQIVIGEDGYPAEMVVPDPRAFVLHKLWLGKQKDREPIKKKRDHAQSKAIAKVILTHLPQYNFEASELRMFPKNVVEEAQKTVFNLALPNDLNSDEK